MESRTIINPSLTKKFIYVVAGIIDYKSEDEDTLIKILTRLKAESSLNDREWNLFGYRGSPTVEYFEENLPGNEVDVVIAPQIKEHDWFPYSTDEDDWRQASHNTELLSELFPTSQLNISKNDRHSFTWYLAHTESKRGHWIQEVPRYFQICHLKGSIYRGLVFRNLTLYRYGDLWLDGSTCRYRTGTDFKRKHARSPHICEILESPHFDSEYIPVIARAKLIPPYAVDLMHPSKMKQ